MPSKLTTDPVRAIHRLKKQINEFLDRSLMVLSQSVDEIEELGTGVWNPPADVLDSGDSIQMFLEVPGVDAEDLDIRINGQTLQISGVRKQPWNNAEGTNVIISERKFVPFEKSVHIEDSIDEDRISSTLEDGVLCIVLPKRKPKKIRIGG